MRLACFFLLLLFAAPAEAQLVTAREYERMLDSGRVAVTTDVNSFFGRTLDAGYSFVQPTVIAAARFREAVFEAGLPFSYFYESNEPGRDRQRFSLGNPWFALAYLPDCSCGLSRLSLGIAVDAAQSDSDLKRRALSLARGAMGNWDGYLWMDHMLPLVAGASTRMDLDPVRLSWDGDLVFGLPAGSRAFEFGTQHAGELALVFNWHWQLAGRISATYYPTFEGDPFQSALSFYLRYVVVQDAIGARFLMNLDGPSGWAFSREGMWGLGLFYSTAI